LFLIMAYIQRITGGILLTMFALALSACASAARPASAERPRANEPPRFAVLAASDERRAAALANWTTVLTSQAAAATPTPELRPVTSTLESLPAGLREYPRLPLVIIKDEKTQTEEETRESLRRFLQTAAPLLGVDLKQLSLVGISDAPASGGGARRALYQQNPFAYPLRNGYGVVEVTFTPDLRVTGLSSTGLPDADQLGRTLASVPVTLSAEQAAAALANRPISYTSSAGAKLSRTVTQAESVAARQLVIFPIRRDTAPDTLELHVAWEVAVGSPESALLVYVDASTGEVLGASQGGQ
jgi:hypothetical protein